MSKKSPSTPYYSIRSGIKCITVTLILFLLPFSTITQASNLKGLKALRGIFEPDYFDVKVKINNELVDNRFFSILVRARQPDSPLIVYFAGGPGASSMPPIFLGSGPLNMKQPFASKKQEFVLNTDYKFSINKWSWNKLANVVYVDQPRYVGFYDGAAPYSTSAENSGKDFVQWLLLFYKKYPEFSANKLYLAGESFGGTYIAQYAHEILAYNKKNPHAIALTGLLVQSGTIGPSTGGNGAQGSDVPPRYQLSFLCLQGLLPSSACEINVTSSLANVLQHCVQNIANQLHLPQEEVTVRQVFDEKQKVIPACLKYTDEVGIFASQQKDIKLPDTSAYPVELRGVTIQEPAQSLEFKPNSSTRQFKGYSPNPYNVSQACVPSDFFPPWCYDGHKLDSFFNNSHVQQILGQGLIKPDFRQWSFASFPVNVAISFDEKILRPDLPSLYAEALNAGLHVVFAFGKDDFDINYVTAQVVANTITQKAYCGRSIFASVPAKLPIDHDGIEAAQLGNLTFSQIPKAGHMIIYDQPKAAFTLLQRLIEQRGAEAPICPTGP